MAETYQQAIAAAKKRYAEAMDEVAWDVLAIVEKHSKPLATVCKDIAGEGWDALRAAAKRRQKTAGQTPEELGRAREKENRRVEESKARAFAKRNPDAAARMVAKVAPKAIEDAYYEGTEVPGRETLTKTAASVGDADRITGPLAHILNVLWKEAQRIASVPTPRRAEREALIEAAGDLRVYADEFESLGHEEISTENLANRLREQNR